MHTVRLTAFPARHLNRPDAFAQSDVIEWSTGSKTAPGDIQVFAVSATLGKHHELADDKRRDAVHSIWQALTPVKAEFSEPEWPVQARFKVLVRLTNPVPKAELVRVGLLNRDWPRNSAGKILKTDNEINALAQVLAALNPEQRAAISNALKTPPIVGEFDHQAPKTQYASDKPKPPKKILTTTYRILRDTGLSCRVKSMHGYKCQICGHTIQLPDGSQYAEGHHIQPLGAPHHGPDIIGNILCLCPNHHAELDYGVRAISVSALYQVDGHAVDLTYVDYHNSKIYKPGQMGMGPNAQD